MHISAQHLTPNGCCKCCMCAVMECGQEKLYAPEQISGMVLEEMRAVADREFGGSATDAVITVPAYFTDDQRQVWSGRGQIQPSGVCALSAGSRAACSTRADLVIVRHVNVHSPDRREQRHCCSASWLAAAVRNAPG